MLKGFLCTDPGSLSFQGPISLALKYKGEYIGGKTTASVFDSTASMYSYYADSILSPVHQKKY